MGGPMCAVQLLWFPDVFSRSLPPQKFMVGCHEQFWHAPPSLLSEKPSPQCYGRIFPSSVIWKIEASSLNISILSVHQILFNAIEQLGPISQQLSHSSTFSRPYKCPRYPQPLRQLHHLKQCLYEDKFIQEKYVGVSTCHSHANHALVLHPLGNQALQLLFGEVKVKKSLLALLQSSLGEALTW